MKTNIIVLFTTVIIISIFTVLGYTSCNKASNDPCKDVHCVNSGACNAGKCVCPSGFTGTYCETAVVPDPCLGVVCQHGGTCSAGTCTCPVGYEGANCQTLARDKFVGAYAGSEACTVGSDTYTITLSAATDDLKLTLTNIYNLTSAASATCVLTSNSAFSFSGATGSITYSGTGRLTGNQLVITYTVTNGSVSNTCTFTGNK